MSTALPALPPARSAQARGTAHRLAAAQSLLRQVEQHHGVTHHASTPPDDRYALAPPLHTLMGTHLAPGGVYVITGSATALCAALIAPSQRGAIIAILGAPHLNMLAAHEIGVNTSALVLVTDPGDQAPTLAATCLDSAHITVIGSHAALTETDRRNLHARARERGHTILATSPWPGAHTALTLDNPTWQGPDIGRYHLNTATWRATAHTRGPARCGALHTHNATLTMPPDLHEPRRHLTVVP